MCLIGYMGPCPKELFSNKFKKMLLMNGMKEDKTTQGQCGHEHMQCQIP